MEKKKIPNLIKQVQNFLGLIISELVINTLIHTSYYMENDREIFSMVFLSLPLIQEGQSSVSGEKLCIILVNHLED